LSRPAASMMSKTGKIIIDRKKPVIYCTVIDLSASGLAPSVHACWAPQTVRVLVCGVKKKVQLIWTRGFTIGVLISPLSASQGRPKKG